jgi:hypothetical protein
MSTEPTEAHGSATDTTTPSTSSPFLVAVAAEVAKARAKHPGEIHTPHEAFGVIWEELDEFWDEVRAQRHDPHQMLKELIQTAAMCQRAAEDLLLIATQSEVPRG